MARPNRYLLAGRFIFQLKGMTETFDVDPSCWDVDLKMKLNQFSEESHAVTLQPKWLCGLLQEYRWCASTNSQLTGVTVTQPYCGEV